MKVDKTVINSTVGVSYQECISSNDVIEET
jgi:hypothetical protein